MNLPTLKAEDISELLIKIIEFTQARQKIFIKNIINYHSPGFTPMDLEIVDFCGLLNNAIDEHIQNQQFVLRDTENIKFNINNGLQIKSVIDECAKQLLEENRDEYLKVQINNLFENSLNQIIAAELLRQRQETTTIGYRTIAWNKDESNEKGPNN